jgi:hypothetical protein
VVHTKRTVVSDSSVTCNYENIFSHCSLLVGRPRLCETADSETCSFLRKQRAHCSVTCMAIEVVYLMLPGT